MLGRRNNPATLVSSLYLLRGRAYEELDNRERAIEWYTKALVANVSCVEAFNRLIEQRMLSSEQEQTLLLDLPWVPDDRWLCLMYQSKIMTYQGEVEEEKEQTEQTEQKSRRRRTTTLSNNAFATGDGNMFAERNVDVRFEHIEQSCQMSANIDIIVSKAECCLYEQNPSRCYELTSWVRERDSYNLRCNTIHVSAMVELGHKSELFYCAHNLVSIYPERAISWYVKSLLYMLVVLVV